MSHLLPPPFRIPEDEWYKRATEFFSVHRTEYMRIEAHAITEMFNLYNDRMNPKESGRSCAGCRGRVYRRLQAHYLEMVKAQVPQATFNDVLDISEVVIENPELSEKKQLDLVEKKLGRKKPGRKKKNSND